ncbi:hypothetical protein B9J93_23245 [Vibrio sp. V17_P4S1T151]|nr:hypothetical protein CMV05_02050 [Vibrio anguillarum]OXX39927.1 hypothetical protein B9J93_23245 [Vibrio sp. V17_P4S1T151]OXX62132.1 hypothetical protein B9J89_11530 [Vibrio sp. V15_P4S5T153]OXX66605.1 hypothetical protein B9J94_12830 [Vibrio sp. V20_P4S3T152]
MQTFAHNWRHSIRIKTHVQQTRKRESLPLSLVIKLSRVLLAFQPLVVLCLQQTQGMHRRQ